MKSALSGYVVRVEGFPPPPLCPAAHRAEGRGTLRATQCRLLKVREAVRRGSTLVDAVADGTVEGWNARQALADALGSVRVPQWDEKGFV